jgi:glutamate-1-semialdehyde 2,1-aminomutase
VSQVLEQTSTPWAVDGRHTGIHIVTNWNRLPITPAGFDTLAMRTHGADLSPWPGAPVSAAHGPAELDATVAAFRASLDDLRAEGEIAPS